MPRNGFKRNSNATELEVYNNGVLIGAFDAGGLDLESGMEFSVNGSAVTASSLDAAYNGGASIAVDGTAVTLTGSHGSNATLVVVGAGTGALIDLDSNSTGVDIDGSDSTWSVSKTGAISAASLTLSGDIDISASATGTYDLILKDSVADALSIRRESTADVIVFDTSTPKVTITPNTVVSGTMTSTGDLTVGANKVVVTASTGATTFAQAVTVSAGGITVTGDSTITGDVTITGGLSWTGTTTIGETLTVDELVLDTDGVALGATYCGLWRDNSGDASLQCITGKEVKFLVASTVEAQIGGTETIFNEAGGDRNFRVESDNLQYALYVDGAKDCVVIGDNTDISDIDYRLMVGNVAKTLATGQSAALLYVAPTASTTEYTGGTHGYIASAYFAEPNITHAGGGTITTAATVYINDAPTEGDTYNAALYVAAGATILQGAVVVNEASADVDFRVESNNLAYALAVDGGKDCVVIGDNTDISDVDYRCMIGNVAKTLSDNQSASILYVAPTASTTESGTGATTHGYIATAYFAEPNITDAGTSVITNAATVYIADAPTEGAANHALYIGSGALTVASGAVTLDGGAFTFNDSSADLDFRVESNNLQYALYVDGGNDCVVIGDDTDISDVDYRLRVGNVAKTLADNQSAAIMSVAPTAATTESGTGATTHGYIATAYFAEPNITHAGTSTITIASTVYINDAPTEGAANYAVYVGAGGLRLNSGDITLTSGDLDFTAASDIGIAAATAAALEISDGTTKFYAVDTRVATVAVTTHAFDISDYTLASAAGAVATGMSLAAHTLNYTGTTQVTTQVDTVVLGVRSLVGADAVTVDEANTLVIAAPTEGANVTLTATAALRILATGGTPVNNYGVYIEDQTAGTTSDVGIYIAGADTAAIYVAADPVHVADNVVVGFGTGTGVGAYDASISYNATNLVIEPAAIGTGVVNIQNGLTLEGGKTFQADSGTEIGISVTNDALTIGSAGSLKAPYLSSTDNLFSDAIGGNVNGCIGVLNDTDGGPATTIEARVEGTWLSVAVAGIEIQGKTFGGKKGVWHDNQKLPVEGDKDYFVDETICVKCGKKMKVDEPVVLYPNNTRNKNGRESVHCIFAHLTCCLP